MKLAGPKRRNAPFLAMPPFPRRRVEGFALSSEPAPSPDDSQVDALIESITRARVGGSYWAAQPDLGSAPFVLVRQGALGGEAALPARMLVWCERRSETDLAAGLVGGECDPWHMLSGAAELICRRDDPLQLFAALSGVPVRFAGEEASTRQLNREQVRSILRAALGPKLYLDPFSGAPLSWMEVVDLCAEWRRLIDSNRDIAAVYGFAGWKRATTEPLLWNGSKEARFDRRAETLSPGQKAAIWRSRTSPAHLTRLEAAGAVLVEVEDGFIRSAGLGANCVPPQSIVVDQLGVHFDARSRSELERIMQEEAFSPELLARAERLRTSIVSLGLSKYQVGLQQLERRSDRPHVLVPGQVEDDRAVLSSIGPPSTNLDLLRRVRAIRPEAHLIYRPHPDVETGHRRGGIPDSAVLELANEVVREAPISAWIELADEVHVNSSLAGFEALLRSKKVTTYGVPFYAGWGLTDDRGPVPDRRMRQRSLAELVAASLIVYPRYIDPVTNLPCSPEVLISCLAAPGKAAREATGTLVIARKIEGWLKRTLFRSSTQQS